MSSSPFDQYKIRLERAAVALGISKTQTTKLMEPDHVIKKTLRVSLENGEVAIPAYRVQFSNVLGPYKGGIRFHPQADLDEVTSLAALMAIKCAVAHIPMGGGKGGAQFDPKHYSKEDVLVVARAWVRAMAPHIGPDTDVPAPDVNTNAEIIDVMQDEYEKIVRAAAPGAFTGKSVERGGSLGRETATSAGGVMVMEEYLRAKNMLAPGLRVAVQGVGNVGGHAASILFNRGFRIVALSDSKGGIYKREGIDVHQALALKERGRPLAEYPDAQIISNEELLTSSCDILIPSALDNQITLKNAAAVQASVIVELANGPVSLEGDEILAGRGVEVVPDVLANAGGVVVSYFEWLQNRDGTRSSQSAVDAKLKEIMVAAFAEVYREQYSRGGSLRDAAFTVGISRILNTAIPHTAVAEVAEVA